MKKINIGTKMNRANRQILILLIVFQLSMSVIFAHSGRTDSSGGHYNRKTGEYHYHNGGGNQNSGGSNSEPKPYVKVNFPTKQLDYKKSYEPVISQNSSGTYWLESSNPDIVSVVGQKLWAVGFGTATITVSTSEAKTTFKITVPTIYPQSIHAEDIEAYVGGAASPRIQFYPETANQKKITYTSGDPSIATVSDDGIIWCLKKGKVSITAKSENNKTYQFTVNVADVLPDKVELSEHKLDLEINKTDKLLYTIHPYNTTDKTVSFVADNNEILDVDNSGNITPKREGTSDITLSTHNGVTDVVKVHIFEVHPTDVSIDINQLSEFQLCGTNIAYTKNNYIFSIAVLPENTTYPEDRICYIDEKTVSEVDLIKYTPGMHSITVEMKDEMSKSIQILAVNIDQIMASGIIFITTIIVFGLRLIKKKRKLE